MKKNVFSVGLLLGLLATGCSAKTVTPLKVDGKDVIAGYTVPDGNVVNITADDLYDSLVNSTTGSSQLFDQIYKAVVRGKISQDDLSIIEKEVDEEMAAWIQDAKTQAATNGVSKDVMIDNLLEGEGVETQEELKQKKKDAKIVTRVEEQYYDNNREKFITEYVEQYAPVHIRGILVKVAANSDGLFLRQISEGESRKLVNVFTQLQKGEDFVKLAGLSTVSDHSSSQLQAGGSLGIMDLTTGFNGEYKQGIYNYLAKVNPTAATTLRVSEDLLTGHDLSTGEQALGFNIITEAQVQELQSKIETVKDTQGNDIVDSIRKGDYQNSLLPRNIIFNQYFNSHRVSFIEATVGTPANRKASVGGKDVVANSSGEPILVLTDENGVQFIYLENNPFAFPELTVAYYNASTDKVYYTLEGEKKVFASEAEATSDGRTIKTLVPYTSQGYNDKSSRRSTVDTAVKAYLNKAFTSSISANTQFFQFRIYNEFYADLKASNAVQGFGTSAKGLLLQAQLDNYISSITGYRNLLIDDEYVTLWKVLNDVLAIQESYYTFDSSVNVNHVGTHVRPLSLLTQSWDDDAFKHYSKYKFAGYDYE
jgi:hypothetical protein